jgi:hypothetical protein
MEQREGIEEFSMLGGPLYRLSCRLGLVRDGTDTVPPGSLLGTVPWIVPGRAGAGRGLGRGRPACDHFGILGQQREATP